MGPWHFKQLAVRIARASASTSDADAEVLGMSRTARPSAMATAPANAAQMDRRGPNITVSHAKVEPVFRRQASPMTSGTRMHKPARYDMMTSYPDPAQQF